MNTPDGEIARPATVSAARTAGLRWVDDSKPGIRRDGAPGAFRYLAADGGLITDAETIDRILRLVIPPAWTDVWISPLPDRHIQATGATHAAHREGPESPALSDPGAAVLRLLRSLGPADEWQERHRAARRR